MTKRKQPSRSSFVDVEKVLEAVLAQNEWPAIVKLPTPGMATNWCLRANQFRRVVRNEEEQMLALPSGMGTTRFDHLIFKTFASEVIIEPRPIPSVSIRGKSLDVDKPIKGAINDLEDD